MRGVLDSPARRRWSTAEAGPRPLDVEDGGISKTSGLARGDAFFISGAAPLTLTDPALLKSLDCIAIAGGACVLPATGSRAGDPTRLAQGGTCK